MKKPFMIVMVINITILIFYSYILCYPEQPKITPENGSISRLDYLEKKIEDSQKCYSDMINALNIYLTIFLAIVGLSIAGAWWNNIKTSKNTIKEELNKAKVELSEIVLEQLGKNEDKYKESFSVLRGQTYEAFARGYKQTKDFDTAGLWFARALREYYDKSEEYISEEHKGRIIGWILDCLNETSHLSDKNANELNSICGSINDEVFGINDDNRWRGYGCSYRQIQTGR